MPQMMPMMWTLLFITVIMTLLTIMSFLHFFYSHNSHPHAYNNTSSITNRQYKTCSPSNNTDKLKEINNWYWKW